MELKVHTYNESEYTLNGCVEYETGRRICTILDCAWIADRNNVNQFICETRNYTFVCIDRI